MLRAAPRSAPAAGLPPASAPATAPATSPSPAPRRGRASRNPRPRRRGCRASRDHRRGASRDRARRRGVSPARRHPPRLGLLADISSLDGHLIQGPDNNSTWSVLDRLTSYDDQLKPQPMLAESFEVTPYPDPSHVQAPPGRAVAHRSRLHQRRRQVELRAHQGHVAGRGDLEQLRQLVLASTRPTNTPSVLTSDKPRPSMFDMFEYFNMLDPTTMHRPECQDHAGRHRSRSNSSNGSRTTTSRSPGIRIIGCRASPTSTACRSRLRSDPSAAVKQLEGGGLDFLVGPPLQDFTLLEGQHQGTRRGASVPGTFDPSSSTTTQAPFDNKVVRQAMNYALDRKRFADTVLQGTVTPKALPWPQSSPAVRRRQGQ